MFKSTTFSARVLVTLIALSAILIGQDRTIPTAAPPPDPYELVRGPVYVATQPADRVAAMNLVRTAAKNSITHNADMNPFDY